QMKQAGKGVIGMKILGQGELRHKVDESIQFALAHQPDYIDGFTIGSESRGQMEDLLTKIPAASTRA
ncbi:MAG: aldo/keto reductase, partial [Bryobacteraceae bacterium]